MAGSPGTFDGGHGRHHKHARFSSSWPVSPQTVHLGSRFGILAVVPAVAVAVAVAGAAVVLVAVGLLAPVAGQVGPVLDPHTVVAGDWAGTTGNESCKSAVAVGFGAAGTETVETVAIGLAESAVPVGQTGDTVGCLSAGRGTRAGEHAWWWWAEHCRNMSYYTENSVDDWT